MQLNTRLSFAAIFHFALSPGFLLSLLLVASCSSPKAKKEKLLIATAANMQFAMKELAAQFSQQTGIDCDLVISSSGKLTAQIREGAPFDVLVAANMKYPKEVYDNGLALDRPRVYANGKLVLWSTTGGIEGSLSLLTSPVVKHIAVANPKTAPYGEAAIEVLQKSGILEKVRHKLVYGESIAQTNQFITTGAAEIGFTAKSVVLSPGLRSKGHWTDIDDSLYQTIEQGVVPIKTREDTAPIAEQFIEFLFSRSARQILNNFGYQ